MRNLPDHQAVGNARVFSADPRDSAPFVRVTHLIVLTVPATTPELPL
jgi:hypothetical protein